MHHRAGCYLSHPETIATTSPSIPEAFRRQARLRPSSPAIRDSGSEIDYATLESRARTLRNILHDLGLRPQEVVALCFEPGIDFVVAQLAVLDAGAICLPIDPRTPENVQRESLKSTQSRFWLAPPHRPAPPESGVIHVHPTPSPLPTGRHGPSAEPSDVGFILFTSGSTGAPKGVCIRQASVIHLVCDTDYVQVTARDTVMMAAHVAFDATLFETWAPLLNGGCIELVHRDQLLDPEILAARLRDSAVTVAFLTTSLFHLLASMRPSMFGGLRALLVGGEVIHPESVRQVLSSPHPPGMLLNAYGPTEATTFSTCHQITLDDLDGRPIPIGRPIRRAAVLIVDSDGLPLPQGELGEIRIGGPGVAAGYWQRPDLTDERFIPDFQDRGEGRFLYATGDLGRFDSRGILEFHGRRDRQVKLRGHRIELAEVESILRRHPLVADVAVIPDSHQDRTLRLVAFLAWRKSDPGLAACPTPDQLLAWMRSCAASHLVPAIVIVLDRLPRIPSGKLDRLRLAGMIPAAGDVDPANRNETEAAPSVPSLTATALGIWRRQLARNDLHDDSDFFAAGGDSLMAVTMLAAFAQVSGRHVPFGRWLASPTPRNLALQAEATTTGNHPAVFVVEWLLRWESSEGFDIPAHVLPFPPITTLHAASVHHLAQACLQSLDRHPCKAPVILVGYSMAGFVALEMARLLALAGRPPADVWLVDSIPPTSLHRALQSLATVPGRALPLSTLLTLGRAAHSVAEVIHPALQTRFPEFLRRASSELGRTIRVLRTVGTHPKSGQPGSIPSQACNHHWHVWINNAFRPARYEGPVALFLTQPTRLDQPGPLHGWKGHLPNADVIPIPGDHASCIREHRTDLFHAFRTRLDKLSLPAIPGHSPQEPEPSSPWSNGQG